MFKNKWRQHLHDVTTFQPVCSWTALPYPSQLLPSITIRIPKSDSKSFVCRLWPSETGLVAISFYTLSDHISIFRRFHISYKAQKKKKKKKGTTFMPGPISREDRYFFFSARRIPAVFLINSAFRGARADKLPLCFHASLKPSSYVK